MAQKSHLLAVNPAQDTINEDIPKSFEVTPPSFTSPIEKEREKLFHMVGNTDEEEQQKAKISAMVQREEEENRTFEVQMRPVYASHSFGKKDRGRNRHRRRSTLNSMVGGFESDGMHSPTYTQPMMSYRDDSMMDPYSMLSPVQSKDNTNLDLSSPYTPAFTNTGDLAHSTANGSRAGTPSSRSRRPKSAGSTVNTRLYNPAHYSLTDISNTHTDALLDSLNGGNNRELQILERHQSDLRLMERIISNSEHAANTMKQEIGGQAFSSVNAYLRGEKRKQEGERLMRLLRKIEDRTQGAPVDIGEKKTKKKQNGAHVPVSKKSQWIEEIKDRGRNNFLAHVQQQRIEEITIQAQIREEQMETKYKQEFDRMEEVTQRLEQENHALNKTITHMKEEIRSLKYTIEMMRSKSSKQLERELEHQEKLKLFSEYEPIFEDLKRNFKFPNSQAVIERMQMLEKGQTDSYTQLLEAQEQRNKMERQLEETRKREEMKSQKLLNDMYANIEKVEKRNAELLREVSDFKSQNNVLHGYKDRYLTLQTSVLDLWINYVRDIERLGFRDAHSAAEEDPDPSNSLQLISAIKNILVAFTSTKATEEYKKFSMMANGYWVRYFKDRMDLKSRPKKIFQQLGIEIDNRVTEIERLQNIVANQEMEMKAMENRCNQIMRSKNALESEIRAKRPRVDSALSATRSTLSRSSSLNTLQRPLSAPGHRRPQTATLIHRRSVSRTSSTLPDHNRRRNQVNRTVRSKSAKPRSNTMIQIRTPTQSSTPQGSSAWHDTSKNMEPPKRSNSSSSFFITAFSDYGENIEESI